jgi:hypothetical protein
VLHDREIEVALTMARIEPLSTQPGPTADIVASTEREPRTKFAASEPRAARE